jgi:hypothetical protein
MAIMAADEIRQAPVCRTSFVASRPYDPNKGSAPKPKVAQAIPLWRLRLTLAVLKHLAEALRRRPTIAHRLLC